MSESVKKEVDTCTVLKHLKIDRMETGIVHVEVLNLSAMLG